MPKIFCLAFFFEFLWPVKVSDFHSPLVHCCARMGLSFTVTLKFPINVLFALFLQNLFNFVFDREVDLVAAVVDLVPLLLSEPMFKIIVNSMKNKPLK